MDNAAVTPLPAIDNPDHVQAKQAATRWQRFVTTVWDSDYYVKSPQERRLVHKLDCMILTVVCEYISCMLCMHEADGNRLWLVNEVP
jgi:hypothetical protein